MTRTTHLQLPLTDVESQQQSIVGLADEYHTAGEVRLSDGRLARLRAPDPVADRRSDLLLLQARIFRGGRLDPIEGATFRIVLVIVWGSAWTCQRIYEVASLEERLEALERSGDYGQAG